MALECGSYSVALADRGGKTMLGYLTNVENVFCNRLMDDISEARIDLVRPSVECQEILKLVEPNRTEMVIFRDQTRIWEGPVTLARDTNDMEQVHLEAKDVWHYAYRTWMTQVYDNRYPNVTTVVQRASGILHTELARKEVLDPPYNILDHMQVIEGPDGARTARRTEAYEYTVFDHIDELSSRAGLEYTTIGRRILLFDGSALLGQTPVATRNDFVGNIISTSYGMEGATAAAVTDGAGTVGIVGGADAYYGLIEILDSAYDEENSEGPPEAIPESALRSQAARNMAGRNPTPLTVRVPDGSTLNPQGVFDLEHLVPGTWVPLRGSHLGRPIRQMMRFREVRFNWTPEGGEVIQATFGPRPMRGGGIVDDGGEE